MRSGLDSGGKFGTDSIIDGMELGRIVIGQVSTGSGPKSRGLVEAFRSQQNMDVCNLDGWRIEREVLESRSNVR